MPSSCAAGCCRCFAPLCLRWWQLTWLVCMLESHSDALRRLDIGSLGCRAAFTPQPRRWPAQRSSRVLHAHLRSFCCRACANCFRFVDRSRSRAAAAVFCQPVSFNAGYLSPRADARNAVRDLHWLRGSAVVCTGPLLGLLLRPPTVCVFFIASSCPVSTTRLRRPPIVILLCAGRSLAACARLSASVSAQPCCSLLRTAATSSHFQHAFTAAYDERIVDIQAAVYMRREALARLC